MGLNLKARNSSEGWGTGFLLVFFPEDERIDMNKKRENFFSSSSPSPSSPSPDFAVNNVPPLRRTTSNHLLTRAQSTVSICALLICLTFLLFTLSTFEPTAAAAVRYTSRRQLSSNPQFTNEPKKWSIDIFSLNSQYKPKITPAAPNLYALQGLGNLYRRGTKAMNDLIVGHVVESITEQEIRLFLRLLHRSGLTSKSDLVLVFPSLAHSAALETVIREENESFSELVFRLRERNGTATNSGTTFDVTQFVKSSKKEKEWGEPLWGRRSRSNYSDGGGGEAESTRLSYGSVVSFVADELDPENSLAGFLDHVPMRLRRWACYPMLLGRVRRNFKHIMLADVREVFLFGDPLGRVRSRSPESVRLISTEATSGSAPHNHNKHGKKNAAKTHSSRNEQVPVNSAMIMGGARGVRRLSDAMLTGIVRAAATYQQQKRKSSSISESGLFNQLVGNEFILKSANVVTSADSVPDASSLTALNPNSGSSSSSSLAKHAVVWRGNSISAASSIMKRICSLELDSSVYSDC